MWRKASACVSEDNCAEVALGPTLVKLRNSQQPEVSISFSAKTWQSFMNELKLAKRHVGQSCQE